MTAEYIASYEYSLDGWTWTFLLFPTELIQTGVKGDERQDFAVELRHLTATPDCGVQERVDGTPLRFWIAYVGILAVTALFFLGIALSGDQEAMEFLKLAFSVLLFLVVLIPSPLSSLLKKRRLQRYVSFKSIVDGKAVFAVWSALDPDETFDDFVEEIVAAIRSNGEPNPATKDKWQFKVH